MEQNVDTTARTYELGDIGPAGGLIFYNEGTGNWKYLEAAPAATQWTSKQWGKSGTWVSATGASVGTGKDNTASIVSLLNAEPADTDKAAQLCDT